MNLLKKHAFVLLVLGTFFIPAKIFATSAPALTVEVKRPKVVRTNWLNPMTGILFPNECIDAANSENQVLILVRVRFVVDDISAYPPIYVDADFGGVYSGIRGPIQNSELQPVTIDTFNLYEAIYQYHLNVDPICTSTRINFNSSYALKMLTGPGQYSVYPIQDYSGAGEPFDENVFEETSPQTSYPPDYTEIKEICCAYSGVGFRLEAPENSHVLGNRMGERTAVVSDFSVSESVETVQVFPNPFSKNLTIHPIQSALIKTNIRVYHLSGELMQCIDLPIGDIDAREISTANWPAGIYYLRMEGRERAETLKLIKIDN
ncbi:MAG: hypothetical protein DHS20C18_11940 [Saprospiraceae bacterium]|nr:MAG: hypothetical protein DHS20C18_11940 [Saprospiraceae bacterium]